MKATKLLALTTALALGTAAAIAEDSTSSTSTTTPGQTHTQDASSSSSVRLSKLMDANIKSNAGEDLGQLQDLLIDPQTGKIKFAVLGRGGFLGIGEKYVPVPWQAIQVKSEQEFTLNVDKNKLNTAPSTDKEYSNLHDPGYTVRIYRFFAVPADTGMGGAETPGGTADEDSSLEGTKSSSDTEYRDPSNEEDKE